MAGSRSMDEFGETEVFDRLFLDLTIGIWSDSRVSVNAFCLSERTFLALRSICSVSFMTPTSSSFFGVCLHAGALEFSTAGGTRALGEVTSFIQGGTSVSLWGVWPPASSFLWISLCTTSCSDLMQFTHRRSLHVGVLLSGPRKNPLFLVTFHSCLPGSPPPMIPSPLALRLTAQPRVPQGLRLSRRLAKTGPVPSTSLSGCLRRPVPSAFPHPPGCSESRCGPLRY
mmetsp:Transcript_5813/g.13400  ORF Transcript_5813/g.13400 Transcript_5813/m.13400 type:complete len:227 (-) Transcript_5813:27-707(-)